MLVFVGAALAASTRPCEEPVYRYALRYWEVSPYEAVVVHRGPLSPDEWAHVEALDHVNLVVRQVDLEYAADESMVQLYVEAERPATPCVVLRFPRAHAYRGPLVALPLDGNVARALCDSTKRREVVGRLLDGNAVVWIFLATGQATRDVPARQRLEEHLKRLEKAGAYPGLLGDLYPDATPAEARTIPSPRFAVVTVLRRDPAERVFTEILLHIEPDLVALAEHPMVFPVFGRGRALYALVGAGITEANITEAASHLLGRCSCEIKDLNPGCDLLLGQDWNRVLDEVLREDPWSRETLVSIAALAEAQVQETAAGLGSTDASSRGAKNFPMPFAALQENKNHEHPEANGSTRDGSPNHYIISALVIALFIMAMLAVRVLKKMGGGSP